MDSVEEMDPFMAILEGIEEDYLRGVKGVRPKTKGRRKVLNLASSINYGYSSASSWLRKDNAHIVYDWGLMKVLDFLGLCFLSCCKLFWLFLYT